LGSINIPRFRTSNTNWSYSKSGSINIPAQDHLVGGASHYVWMIALIAAYEGLGNLDFVV